MINPKEAAALIEVLAESIQGHPEQFHIEISITGQQVVSTGSGVGLSVTAVGGGPGSRTVGNQVTMGGAQVNLSAKASQAMTDQAKLLVDTLRGLAVELRETEPNGGKVKEFLKQLRDDWVPNVIGSIVSNLVSKAMGI